MVLSTTPVMKRGKTTRPTIRRPTFCQLTMIQPTFRAMAPPARQTPRTMKNATDFRRPPEVMSSCSHLQDISELSSRDFFLRDLADPSDADIPDETGRAEHLEQEPGGIELVPGQAMARGSRMGVMVVVPAFAERDERHPPQVSGIVR